MHIYPFNLKIMPKNKKPSPKIGNLEPNQSEEVEKQRIWLNNWNKNRKINGKNINNNINIPFSKDIYIDDLNYDSKEPSKIYGEYDRVNNRIIFDNTFLNKPGIPSHEFSHRFQNDLRKLNPKNYEKYIQEPIVKELNKIPNLNSYIADPEETHSEINRFRYNNNLKPDQVVNEKDIEQLNLEDYNLKHLNKEQFLNLLNTTADINKNINLNMAAYGGNLKQNNNNNMLNEFNEGGSHEQNPLGGIPQGVGQNGKLNTVEEGETKKDTFIYSDRIKLTPELVSQFNLPKVLANKTAAEATKIINAKFEGRNSTIDNSTKKTMLDRIAEAQETIKQIEVQKQAEISKALDVNSTMDPDDQMNGEIPQGMEEFVPQQQMMYGGNKYFGGGELTSILGAAGTSGALGQHTGINQLTTAMDLGQTAFGKSGIDTSGAVDVNPGAIKPGMMGAEGAMKGIQAGAMFGPLGAGIGGAIGLGAGLVGGFKAKKDALKAHQNFEIGQSNKLISQFRVGGDTDTDPETDPKTDPTNLLFKKPTVPMVGSKIEKPFSLFKNTSGVPYATSSNIVENTPKSVPTVFNQNVSNFFKKEPENTDNLPSRTFGPQYNGHTNYQKFRNAKDKVANWLDETGKKVGNFAKENYGNALRYSPAVMNLLQLRKLNKTGYDTVDPVINNTRYNPQYMDEKALVNQINAESNYAGNALANASNGSMGALTNNILASQLAKTKGLSDAYSRVAEVNRNENKTGQQFNLGVDEANIARRIAAEDKTAMNKGNWETNKSRLLGQIGTDLGNIGKEEVYKKLAKESFGYTWDGKYYVGPKGDKLTRQEMNSKIDSELNQNTTNQNRFGGYMLNGPFLNNRMIKRYK